MKKLSRIIKSEVSLGLTLSLLLHATVAALIFFQWEFEPTAAAPEETVAVELVPPPEEPEEQKPEEKQEDEAGQEAPPPPPPEQPDEQAQGEAEQQSGGATGEDGLPFKVLRPVFEFGDEATDGKQTPQGNAARAEPETEDPPGLDDPAKQEQPAPENVNEPEDTPQETALPPTDPNAYPDPNITVEAADALEEAVDKTTEAKQTEDVSEEEPGKVRTIYSEKDGEAAAAITAMAGLTRGVRGGQLCATELREQLRHATPAYNPSMIPAYRFPEGNVLAVPKGAFRASSKWYDVKFTCEINQDGTKITAFSFQVDGEVPRETWSERGFPEF